MHPEDIKAEIRKKYGSIASFSRQMSLHRQAVSDLLQGHSRPKAARLVAKALGKELDIVFPGQRERENRKKPTKFQEHIAKIRATKPPSRRKVAA